MHPFPHHHAQLHGPVRPPRSSPGFLLLEAAVSNIILAVAIVSTVPIFILTLRANIACEEKLVATQLAIELMEEIRARKFDQNCPNIRPGTTIQTISALGVDTGESSSDKTTFNDVDDFSGWTESPPREPDGDSIPQFTGYARTVTETYLDPNAYYSSSSQSRKHITVCVSHNGVTRVCLGWLSANH